MNLRSMQRAIGLRGALAVNIITMVGIGPLITIPLVLSALNGPLALVGWIAGAVVALCDGLVWSELASRYPGSGGTYVYLREIFGAQRWGRLFAFLFNWQFLLAAPCLLASGYLGFSQYATFAFPAIGSSLWLARAVAMAVGIVTIWALYRRTARVAALGMGLGICAIATLCLVIGAALPHADFHRALALAAPVRFDWAFLAGFGSALYLTLYDYAGYSDAALLGDEVRQPQRAIPFAIVISIVVIAIFYLLLQLGVLGVVPWQSLVGHNGGDPPAQAMFVGSTVVALAWGHWPALIVTGLVLVTAFASVYGNLLGFSRIPFAAARDGSFLPAFARLHPTKDFPHISLLVIGGLSILACFFSLGEVIALCTAGIVLIQGALQIVALVVARSRGETSPFRMPLYPVPAIVAFAGWSIAFWYTGSFAICAGIGWLAVGTGVYLLAGKRAGWWPFAALVVVALLVPVRAIAAPIPSWTTWNTSAVTSIGDTAVFTVDGKPFFVNGAAFFYERIPWQRWSSDLDTYKAMGINTIDLYVSWNWHEPRDGDFDFTGRTGPGHNLRGVLGMIAEHGFEVILRPGPVIRNEWRNGGYPDWLLERPEYRMPLHDVLEGRYPATATFQNAHADAAAAEWMANRTHVTYAARWLHAVLQEVAPYSRNVIAIALDDDQGAYIDNDTWPAPHWHAYIDWLRSTVRSDVGNRVPLFINTYQMKVTASSPVWAWGNWYQSDAYAIGDHDLAQLMFSTALLQTRPGQPVMASEFQAGWLQGADQVAPRPADPTNTTLAMHELLQMGAHGIVDFPPQDTTNPPGWEAPWANHLYDWDAALTQDGGASARFAPTAAFFSLTAAYPNIAALRPKVDAAIAWLPSAYDAALLDNHRVAVIAAATIAVQQRCRALAMSCRLVDLRFDSVADLRRTSVLIVPRTGIPLRFVAPVERTLGAIAPHVRIVHDADAARRLIPHLANGGIVDSALLVSPDHRSGILDVINASATARTIPQTVLSLGKHVVIVPSFTVAPRSARDVLFGPALQRGVLANIPTPAPPASALGGTVQVPPAGASDALSTSMLARNDGISMIDREVRAQIEPGAGGRAFFFGAANAATNAFTSIGALRDDVASPLPPSARDYIAAYTHPFPAGTFNRPYACTILQHTPVARVRCDYDAPDLAAIPVHFEKTFTLAADSRTLAVMLRSSSDAVSVSAITDDPSLVVGCPSGPGVTCTIEPRDGYRLLRLAYPANTDTTLTFTLQGPAP